MPDNDKAEHSSNLEALTIKLLASESGLTDREKLKLAALEAWAKVAAATFASLMHNEDLREQLRVFKLQTDYDRTAEGAIKDLLKYAARMEVF